MRQDYSCERSKRNTGTIATLLPIIAGTVLLLLSGVSAQAQNAFVRINQVGYVTTQAKRAYLISKTSESGATFVVKNSANATVLGPAAIGGSLGTWGSFTVYPLDFDGITAPDTYTITVTGP